MLADQTLLRIEYIHSKSFIHRVRCNGGVAAPRYRAPSCASCVTTSLSLASPRSHSLAQDIKPDNFLMGTGR